MRKVWALLCAVIAAVSVGVGLVPSGNAAAHASLTGSSPAEGSIVTEPVDSVTLTFSEAVEPTQLGFVVTLADGRTLIPESNSTDAATWTLEFVAQRQGLVTVAYDVISADGHPITGTLTFTVDAPAPSTTPAPASPAPTASAAPTTVPATTAPLVVATAPDVAVASPPTVPGSLPGSADEGSDVVVPVIAVIVVLAVVGGAVWAISRRRS